MYTSVSKIEHSEIRVVQRDESIEDRTIQITCGSIYLSFSEEEAFQLVKQIAELLPASRFVMEFQR